MTGETRHKADPDMDEPMTPGWRRQAAKRLICAYARALFRCTRGYNGDDLTVYYWACSRRVYDGWVYFYRCDQTVKIGFSTKPIERIEALNRMAPPDAHLVGTMTGGRDQEQKLHRRFRRSRMRGEWFRLSPALWQYIIDKTVLHVDREAL